MKIQSRRDIVWLVLTSIFITNAVLAEIIGVKLIMLPFTLPWIGQPAASIGVIPWPIVFLSTDLINEYFGRAGVKRLTMTTIAMVAYAFVVIFLSISVPAADFSPIDDATFSKVFGQSLWIIVASIIAFGTSQLIDVTVFWYFRNRTKGKLLWLRATGSTIVSQLVDSLLIVGIAFWLSGQVKTEDFLRVALTNYSYKLIIAVAMTPFLYLVHNLIDSYLGKAESESLIDTAARQSLGHE